MSDFDALASEVADAFDLGVALGPMVEVPGGEQARIWRRVAELVSPSLTVRAVEDVVTAVAT